MTDNRLPDYLGHMREAAANACVFVNGWTRDDFLTDLRTQQAVIMNLIILGESAARIIETSPDFILAHPEIPWRSIRGMRNRIAHGYFEINLDVVWDTVQTSLPELIRHLRDLS